MKKLTTSLFIMHTALFIITGFGVWYMLNKFFPEILIDQYFVIPLFFYLIGLIFIFRFRRAPINEPQKINNLYMLMRMAKIFLSLIIILLYWIIHKPDIRNFAIVFLVFYFINLVWETYLYIKIEQYFKYKSDQQKSAQKQLDQ